ncbi:TetR family transcriptional regulator [Paenibacillus sp. KS-LC4]|uniref:TetR family transcriptional regulator n=1 Tax=Paenibacillus sp. KS-LC4 TaxID=2979727 RepID=UPI0030D2714E
MKAADIDVKMRILLAAKKLFAAQGFDRTSVRQICEEAGANVALISYYFGGKDNLFFALFEAFFPSRGIASIAKDMDPLEGMKLIIRELLTFRDEDAELSYIIQHEFALNTPRIAMIQERVLPLWQLIYQWLLKGREQGVFEFNSVHTVFKAVSSTLLFPKGNNHMLVLMGDDVSTLEEQISETTAFIFKALKPSEQVE